MAEPRVKKGSTDPRIDVSSDGATIFSRLVPISRYRGASSHRPKTGPKPDGMAVNGESFYARATIFTDSCSYESEPAPDEPKRDSEISGASRPGRKKF